MIHDDVIQNLVQRAIISSQLAYAPYSNYPVGAALLAQSGRIYDGMNIENAAYPCSICAERVAIYKAVSEGERLFTAMAVVTSNAGLPCGSCRQVMAEFGLDTLIIVADSNGKVTDKMTVGEMLPGAFTPDWLPGKHNGQ